MSCKWSPLLCSIGVLFKAFTTRHVPCSLKESVLDHVRPVLEYASNVWVPYLIKHMP